jgi:hypothetical protein
METAKIPKFKWDEISDQNSGHTPDEWGIKKIKRTTCSIYSYTVAWDK